MALPKPATPTYELTLPSTGKTIKFRPFLVKEEKLLLLADQSEDFKQKKQAIKDVIKACILSRVKVEELPYFDLEYIFLQLRARSAEEFLELEITCRDDGETRVTHTINLLEVEVQGAEEENPNKIMLSEDMGVVLKYPSMDDFINFAMLGETLDETNVYDYVASRIDQIFDADEVTDSSDATKKELIDWVDNLTSKQLAQISSFFEKLPKLRHEFFITNPNTGVELKYVMEGLKDFFVL